MFWVLCFTRHMGSQLPLTGNQTQTPCSGGKILTMGLLGKSLKLYKFVCKGVRVRLIVHIFLYWHTDTEEEGCLLELFLPGSIVGIKNRGFPRVQARRQRTVGGSKKETHCWSVTSPNFDFLAYTSCDYLLFRGLMVALCVLFRVFSCNQWKRQECVSSSISAELEPQNFQK